MAPRRIPSTSVLLTVLTVWAAPFPTADPAGQAHPSGISHAVSWSPAVPGQPSAVARYAGRTGGVVTAATGACVNPAQVRDEDKPWALRRLPFDVVWRHTRGEGVRIAVIDTGVDDSNPQLRAAVDSRAGADFLSAGGENRAGRADGADGRGAKDPHDSEDPHKAYDGTLDTVGHGTKVAGIIAARPLRGTGFVGLAPGATIIPIRHNDERHTGDTRTLALAIDHAIAEGAHIINISQATSEPEPPGSPLGRAVRRALDLDIVVVASAGNSGTDSRPGNTFPAAFDGVLAVAASDRDNERAVFSQPGAFIGVAAPGVDIVSTLPGGGHCADSGTSFAAPYVTGVAALLRARHPHWSARRIVSRIEETARRDTGTGHDSFIGWGVVDPVRALGEDGDVLGLLRSVTNGPFPAAPQPAPLVTSETPQERLERRASRAVVAAVVLLSVIVGAAVVSRAPRRRGACPGGWRTR